MNEGSGSGRDKQSAQAAHRDVKTAIVDAAETVFARSGFDGATTRAIADEASVNLALIHYHFSSKERLYETVLSRRLIELNETRESCLHKAMRDDELTLEAVFDAFMRPAVELANDLGSSGVNHARIVAQIIYGADERSERLRNDIFGKIAHEFIVALRRAMPELDPVDAARAHAYSGTLLINELTDEKQRTARVDSAPADDGVEDVIRRITTFSAAGVRAMANSRRNPAPGNGHAKS